MKKRICFLVLVAAAAFSGCSTKNYGRQGELTGYERETMSCREIELEIAKVHGFVRHVDKESEFDGRSVLSFLGDFGIGNLMERSSAVESATTRLAQLQDLRARRSCSATTAGNAETRGPQFDPPAALAAAGTPSRKHTVGEYSYEAEQLAEVRSCNPYPAPTVVAKGAGFEAFTVACTSGDVLSVRCEATGCRVLR